ncbi:MAG: MerR family transcriptional regulator, partial [Bacillati bacterium ANGP1]
AIIVGSPRVASSRTFPEVPVQDLAYPFLPSRVVLSLTGLSARTLRRLEVAGVLAPRRSRGPRLYSWREVERLQQAAHLVKAGRLSVDEVKRLLRRSHAASLDRDWVIARPRPRVRRGRALGGAGGLRGTPTRRMR